MLRPFNSPEDAGQAAQPSADVPFIFDPTTVGVLPAGTVLNGTYRIDRLIATGGMGAVYKAHNIHASNLPVAVKVLRPELSTTPQYWDLFKREAQALLDISHPAVVRYQTLSVDIPTGSHYLVTEFIDGVSLEFILRGYPAAVPDVLDFILRIAEGLLCAHSARRVHRDLSPDNILLPNGMIEQAKIIDFGITKHINSIEGSIIGDQFAGKINYAAPEQFSGRGEDIGPWTDVYCLGLLGYSFAVGTAFKMGQTAWAITDRRQNSRDVKNLPPQLRSIIGAMLRVDRTKRPQSMGEVIDHVKIARSRYRVSSRVQSTNMAAEKTVVVDLRPGIGTQFVEPSAPPIETAVVSTGVGRHSLAKRLGMAAIAASIGTIAILMVLSHPRRVAVPVRTEPKADVSLALRSALLNADCSLLQIKEMSDGKNGPTIALTGASSAPASVANLLGNVALKQTPLNLQLEDVAPVPNALCSILDSVRPASAPLIDAPNAVTSAQPRYEFGPQPSGNVEAVAVLTVEAQRFPATIDLFLIGPSAQVSFVGRWSGAPIRARNGTTLESSANGAVRVSSPMQATGRYGLLAVGRPGLPLAPTEAPTTSDLYAMATQKGASSAAAWFAVVDEQANAPWSPAPPSPHFSSDSPTPAHPKHVRRTTQPSGLRAEPKRGAGNGLLL